MTPSTVRLSVRTFRQLWVYEGLGRRHPAASAALEWLDDDERSAAEDAMFAELTGKGLAVDREPVSSLRAVLRAIADPDEDFYGFFDQQRGDLRDRFSAVAARAGRTAILAILDDEELELRPVDPAALAHALVDLALPCPARPGQSLSVATTEIDANGRAVAPEPADPDDIYTPEPGEQAQRFARLLAEPRLAVGQLYAARRGRDGTPQRCAHPLTYLDTRAGRVYTTIVHARGRRDLIAVPATQQLLVEKLLELATALATA